MISFISVSYARNEEDVGYIMKEAKEGFRNEPSKHISAKVEAQFNEAVNHDSNVTQLPDGQTSVVGKSGSHSITNIKLKFNQRTKTKKKVLDYVLKAGITKYLQKEFGTRNSKHFSFGFGKTFKRDNAAAIPSFTLKSSFRQDYLYSFGSKEKGFDTFAASIMGVMKPKKVKKRYADTLIPVIGLNLDNRLYKNAYKPDAFNASKDTLSQSMLFLLIGMKKHQNFKSKPILLLNIRNASSKSNEQDYMTYSSSFMWKAAIKQYEITPSLGFSYRDQSNYQGTKRNDNKFDIGCKTDYKFNKSGFSVMGEFKYSKQDSNLSQFKYDNLRIALSGEIKI
jgi:hypothetical protein